jgi:hypothetical protein
VISDQNRVLLEVEWDEICRETKVERIDPFYNKTDILGLQAFLPLSLTSGQEKAVAWRKYGNILRI